MRRLLAALALLVLIACAPRAPDIQGAMRDHPVELTGPMTFESVELVEKALLVERRAGRPLVLMIDSSGGIARSGVRLHEFLEKHAPVVCVVTGEASSAAFLALQGCSERIAVPEALLVAHNPFLMIPPSFEVRILTLTDLRRIYRDLQDIADIMVRESAKRMGMSPATLRAKLALGDWVMTANEALLVNAIDRVEVLRVPPPLDADGNPPLPLETP